jgi:hypothetical protein
MEMIPHARDCLRPGAEDDRTPRSSKIWAIMRANSPSMDRGEPVTHLDQGHGGSQRVEDGGEFDPDRATAHYAEALRQRGETVDLVHIEDSGSSKGMLAGRAAGSRWRSG